MDNTFLECCQGNRYYVYIPDKFTYKEGTVESGFVISDDKGNQYVRIPSGYTTGGFYVRGFWFSRYEISLGEDKKTPLSVANKYPATNMSYFECEKMAEKVGGFLIDQYEYDRICMWLVETKAATFEEIFINGERGNYSNPFIVAKTGSNPKWMLNRLDNFLGNCYIWTSEKSELCDQHRIIRGGHGLFFETNKNYPASYRAWDKPEEGRNDISFRIVLKDVLKSDDDD